MTHPGRGTTARRPLSRATLILTAILILIVGVLGGGAVGWLRRTVPTSLPTASPVPASSSAVGDVPSTPVPSTSVPSTPSPLPPSPSHTPNAPTAKELERQARDKLETLAAEGFATANPRGQWVAQLSSKWIGISDPAQTAVVSGGHKFAAVDIVAEYEATKQKAENLGGATVVLIKGSDIKKGRDETSGHLFWYIFAVDFGSKSEADRWCQDLYPRLSGDRLKNVCFATPLNP